MKTKMIDIVNKNLATIQETYLISLLNLNDIITCPLDREFLYNEYDYTNKAPEHWMVHKFIIKNDIIYGYRKDSLNF